MWTPATRRQHSRTGLRYETDLTDAEWAVIAPLTRPSPFPRWVGIRIVTFEASSGFTRVTARWIAQPPKAAFVTRLQPSQLPGQAARQLPDQSTTLWVEPSSTGDTRRRGAPGNPG